MHEKNMVKGQTVDAAHRFDPFDLSAVQVCFLAWICTHIFDGTNAAGEKFYPGQQDFQ